MVSPILIPIQLSVAKAFPIFFLRPLILHRTTKHASTTANQNTQTQRTVLLNNFTQNDDEQLL